MQLRPGNSPLAERGRRRHASDSTNRMLIGPLVAAGKRTDSKFVRLVRIERKMKRLPAAMRVGMLLPFRRGASATLPRFRSARMGVNAFYLPRALSSTARSSRAFIRANLRSSAAEPDDCDIVPFPSNQCFLDRSAAAGIVEFHIRHGFQYRPGDVCIANDQRVMQI